MKKYLNYAILAMLFAVPIFYSQLQPGSPPLREQQWTCLLFFATLLLAFIIENVWVSLFVLLSLGHALFFRNQFSDGQMTVTAIVAFIYHVFSTYRVRWYRETFLVLLIINLILAGFQHFNADVFTWMNWRENGMMATSANLGMLSALIAAPLATLNPWFALLSLLGVWWSESVACKLALAVAMGFYGYHVNRRLTKYVALIMLCVAPLSVFVARDWYKDHLHQSSRRFHVWKMAASKAFRNPFFGYGMGSLKENVFWEFRDDAGKRVKWMQFKDVPENYPDVLTELEALAKSRGLNPFSSLIGKDPNPVRGVNNELMSLKNNGLTQYRWDSLHNHYLEVFFEFGFCGLFILFGFIFDKFKDFNRFMLQFGELNIEEIEMVALMASFLVVLIISFVHFPLAIARLSIIVLALTGMLEERTKIRPS